MGALEVLWWTGRLTCTLYIESVGLCLLGWLRGQRTWLSVRKQAMWKSNYFTALCSLHQQALTIFKLHIHAHDGWTLVCWSSLPKKNKQLTVSVAVSKLTSKNVRVFKCIYLLREFSFASLSSQFSSKQKHRCADGNYSCDSFGMRWTHDYQTLIDLTHLNQKLLTWTQASVLII